MVSRFIALLAVCAAYFGVWTATFWFAFGIWPKSWASLVTCIIGLWVVQAAANLIGKEIEKAE